MEGAAQANVARDDQHILLKTVDQDNAILKFMTKKHTALKKLMNGYSKKTGLSLETLRFRYDGTTICETHTPSALGMKEGAKIYVFPIASEWIILSVHFIEAENAHLFKMKKRNLMKKLMNTYCKKVGLSWATARFRINGMPVCETDTPVSLELEDGDTIDVFRHPIA